MSGGQSPFHNFVLVNQSSTSEGAVVAFKGYFHMWLCVIVTCGFNILPCKHAKPHIGRTVSTF